MGIQQKLFSGNSEEGKELFVLLFKLVLIWLSWKGISYVLGEESQKIEDRMFPSLSVGWEWLNDQMRALVLGGAEKILHMLSYETVNTGYALRLKGYKGIAVGNYCLGFQLMYYFIMLVIISSLPPLKKITASLTGVGIVVLLNFFRIAGFAWIIVKAPSLLSLSHDYIFNAVVMGVLMLFYFYLNGKK